MARLTSTDTNASRRATLGLNQGRNGAYNVMLLSKDGGATNYQIYEGSNS